MAETPTTWTNPILVISDYFSPTSRRALKEEGFNYVDTTGNVRIELDSPALFLELEGANRSPTPSPNAATLKGATAGRLLRFLVDVRPPYRLSDIESATGINKGYLSRLLEALTSEGLITRPSRGPITDVDWPEGPPAPSQPGGPVPDQHGIHVHCSNIDRRSARRSSYGTIHRARRRDRICRRITLGPHCRSRVIPGLLRSPAIGRRPE